MIRSEEHFKKLERMYHGSNINQNHYPSIQMVVSAGRADISLTLDPSYLHAGGGLHGSVFFKLLDDAAYFAASSQVQDFFILTTSFALHFLRPMQSGQITATGTLKFASPQLFVAESVLRNESGKEIAFGTGQFVKSKLLLSEKLGYG